jgi:hypothetical protein
MAAGTAISLRLNMTSAMREIRICVVEDTETRMPHEGLTDAPFCEDYYSGRPAQRTGNIRKADARKALPPQLHQMPLAAAVDSNRSALPKPDLLAR